MGCEVLDPCHIEGEIERLPGLGLLPVSTTITQEKITRQSSFMALPLVHGNCAGGQVEKLSGREYNLKGYEIHMGESVPFDGQECRALNLLEDGREDGCFVSNKCMGTYMHGILDNAEFVGFKTGDELKRLIAESAISVCPSEWYENCPFSVIESQISQWSSINPSYRRWTWSPPPDSGNR